MNEAKDTDRLLKMSTSALDQAVDELDDAILRDLRRVRREVLSVDSKQAVSEKRPVWLLPVGGLATMATVAVLTVSLWLTPPENLATQLPPLEDLALLGDVESLEFYEELDFYLWLDDEEAG